MNYNPKEIEIFKLSPNLNIKILGKFKHINDYMNYIIKILEINKDFNFVSLDGLQKTIGFDFDIIIKILEINKDFNFFILHKLINKNNKTKKFHLYYIYCILRLNPNFNFKDLYGISKYKKFHIYYIYLIIQIKSDFNFKSIKKVINLRKFSFNYIRYILGKNNNQDFNKLKNIDDLNNIYYKLKLEELEKLAGFNVGKMIKISYSKTRLIKDFNKTFNIKNQIIDIINILEKTDIYFKSNNIGFKKQELIKYIISDKIQNICLKQKFEIIKKILNYEKNFNLINHYYNINKNNGKNFLHNLISIEPNIINGKIDLVKNSNSLIFYFHITKDFEEICKICKSSVNSNGITLFGNILKIKELNGCIILIKGKKLKESENGFFEQNNIISHELRHIRDFYLNNDLNYIDIPPDNNIERALILSKKEILAYLTMARKLDEIYSTLTNENGMYNFFRNRFFYPGLCFGSKTYNKLFINYKKNIKNLLEIAFKLKKDIKINNTKVDFIDILSIININSWKEIDI